MRIKLLWFQWNRHVMCFIASFLPSNQTGDRSDYPQTWWCMPKCWKTKKESCGCDSMVLTRRSAFLQGVCKVFTGHEISKTEWGYGGGKFVDRHCRWCDKLIKVPKIEEEPPEEIGDTVNLLGFNE